MTQPEAWPDRRETDRDGRRAVLRPADGARAAADSAPVVSSARAAAERLRATLPAEQMAAVEGLADLVSDKDWVTPPSVAPRVLTALQHFADTGATELIEIAAGDLRRELEGYQRFDAGRERLRGKHLRDSGVREQRLARLRRRLRARVQTWRHRDEHGWLVSLR